jgi:hypothetical protein
MSRRTLLIALGAGVVAAACTDATGPPLDDAPSPYQEQVEELVVPDGALPGLRWTTEKGVGAFAILPAPDDEGPGEELPVSITPSPEAGPPQLDRYEVSFWAVRGKRRSIQINYETEDGLSPFLRLTIPRRALHRRPDGSRIEWGEAVLITVIVDRTRLRVELEPDGIQFSRWIPARLKIWYGGADWDFNGDGVVDERDDEAERRLRMWTQEEDGGPWRSMRGWHSRRGKWLLVKLYHFTGYEVST